MKRIVALAVFVLSLVGAGVAGAVPPSTTESHFAWSGTDTYTCGFPLASAYSVDVMTRTFVDQSGTAVRAETLNRAKGTLTGPTGRVARFEQIMNTSLDVASNVLTVTGVVSKVTGSGEGVLLSAVGRLVLQLPPPGEVLTQSARPQMEPGAYAPVCEYLAGP